MRAEAGAIAALQVEPDRRRQPLPPGRRDAGPSSVTRTFPPFLGGLHADRGSGEAGSVLDKVAEISARSISIGRPPPREEMAGRRQELPAVRRTTSATRRATSATTPALRRRGRGPGAGKLAPTWRRMVAATASISAAMAISPFPGRADVAASGYWSGVLRGRGRRRRSGRGRARSPGRRGGG